MPQSTNVAGNLVPETQDTATRTLLTFAGGGDDEEWRETSNQIQMILDQRDVIHIAGQGYQCEIW